MYDIIQFKASKEEEKRTGLQLIYSQSLAQNTFKTFLNLEDAKNQLRHIKIVHFPLYKIDQGIIRKIKENQNIVAIALSDFFLIDEKELSNRLSRLQFFIKIVKKFDLDVRFFTLAKNTYQLRTKYELLFAAKYFGFDINYINKIEKEKFSIKM